MFLDRNEAANQLAEKLIAYRGKNPLVLAIPRGAVPMAKIITAHLGGGYDVVLVRKLRAPLYPEFAIGAVDESGWMYVADYAARAGADDKYIAYEKQLQMDAIKKRRELYTPTHGPIETKDRIVIIVDDGLATGASMIAALHNVRKSKPAKLICAVPVAPRDTLKKVAALADEVICLETPDDFEAVGQFYVNFPQVEDSEVIAILESVQRQDTKNIYQTHSFDWQ
jgi:predicted phosphoribosyltransferase